MLLASHTGSGKTLAYLLPLVRRTESASMLRCIAQPVHYTQRLWPIAETAHLLATLCTARPCALPRSRMQRRVGLPARRGHQNTQFQTTSAGGDAEG